MNKGTKTFALTLAGAALALSGCGATTDIEALLNFADTMALADAIDADWGAVSYTDPALLPTTGSATYDGVMNMTAATLAIVGEMQLTADFAGSAISGDGRNFVDAADNRYNGTLAVSNGFIDRLADPAIEFTFDADLDGTLTNSGETYDYAGFIDGDFVGPSHEAVFGEVTGTVNSSSGTDFFLGGFLAER